MKSRAMMKHKTLMYKKFETIVTEGRHAQTPPCDACARTTPPSPAPTRQRGIYADQEDRGELEITHAQRIQSKHVVPKHVNERAVVLLLLVLFQLWHGTFRTCRIVTFIHFSHRSGTNKPF